MKSILLDGIGARDYNPFHNSSGIDQKSGAFMKKASNFSKAFASMTAAVAMTGCSTMSGHAGMSSPLSAEELQNTQICTDFDTAQAKVASIPVGTPKAEVYAAFGIKGDDALKRLSKEDINRTVYGQSTLNITFDQRVAAQNFLNSLEGRSLTCQNVHSKRSFGLTHSLVERNGYQYTLTFIFKDAKLYDPVSISGEPVKQKQNRGYLSEFNPAETALRAVRPF